MPPLLFDGSFDQAIEQLLLDNESLPSSSGHHSFNIR